MFEKLDRSESLSRLIKWVSSSLAAQRGLPLVVAIGLTVLSLVVHIVWLSTNNAWIGVCAFGVLHLAMLIGFIGLLLAEPLGRG